MATVSEPAIGPKVSEAEFLAAQADAAKTAAFAALRGAHKALEANLDPRVHMRKHPLITVGSATLAGFAAALLAIPSKEEQELRRLERYHRALHPESATGAASNGDNKGHAAPAPPSTLWSTLIHEVIQLIRPILMTVITAGVKNATNPTPISDAQGPDKSL